ncbi:MAG: GntR family transcriptional regulator [Gorillibacterium sp.]|nr:GntR family transcriptional regulator [Gorillibacterium sp.]
MTITRKKGPLYLQIKKIIKDRIIQGVYPLGTIIPSEPQLENEFQVSKMTVRNAIKELSQEGYVEKKSGFGTIVLRNTSYTMLSKGKRFTEILLEEGHQLEKRLLSSALASNEAGSYAYELFGPFCQRIERLYILDGQPYIHFIHFLTPAALADKDSGATEINIQSLYDLLEEKNITLEYFKDRFAVEGATSATRLLLDLPEYAYVLKRSRNSYDGEGKLIEYSIGYYNTELHQYVVSYDT